MSDTVHQPSSSWSEIKRLLLKMVVICCLLECVLLPCTMAGFYTFAKKMWRVLSKLKAREM